MVVRSQRDDHGGALARHLALVDDFGTPEGLLDMTDSPVLDHYLVLAGPRSAAASSRGAVRPWCNDSVHLFDAQELLAAQRERGVKIGIASSVRAVLWEATEIYPRAANPAYSVNAHQAALLRLFAPR